MAKSEQVHLLLIRSGRTEWDDAGRLQGRTDLPLSPSGRSDLTGTLPDSLGDGDDEPSQIVCGPDEASRETAEYISERTGAKVRSVPGLAAMKLGLWEGLLESDIEERHPSCYRQWRDDPASINVPEGETLHELQERLAGAMMKVCEKANGRPVAVVLRPIEYALCRCWLNKKPTSELWTMLEDGPQTERHVIPRGLFKGILEDLKART